MGYCECTGIVRPFFNFVRAGVISLGLLPSHFRDISLRLFLEGLKIKATELVTNVLKDTEGHNPGGCS